MSDEQVLVIARDKVPDAAGWYGLRTDGMAGFLATVGDHARFALRDEMEVDPAWKQLIPYLVLRDGERYFLMVCSSSTSWPSSTAMSSRRCASPSRRAASRSLGRRGPWCSRPGSSSSRR